MSALLMLRYTDRCGAPHRWNCAFTPQSQPALSKIGISDDVAPQIRPCLAVIEPEEAILLPASVRKYVEAV